MKRLRDNRTLRPAGWVLFAAAVCAALLLGQQFLFALWYTQFGDWTTTWAFDTNLNQRTYQVQDYVQLQTDLDSGSLDYVEREQTVTLLAATREALSPERTNFRYQILSADGAQVLDTNLQDSSQSFETQVTGVYYGVLTVNGGQVDFTAKSEPWTASMTASYSAGAPVPSEDSQSSAILRYGVLKPELMVVQDEFRSLLTLCDGYAANGPLYGGLALVFLGAAAFLLLRLSSTGRLKGDAAIAMISTGALAVGVLVISLTSGVNTNVSNYMFGSILTVSRADAALSVILCAAVLVCYTLFYPRLFAVTFDETFMRATGGKAGRYNMLLAVLTAVTVVLGMRMMGALLISSLIIFPPLAAMRVFRTFKSVTVCSAALSVVCFIIGMTASYALETPSGASVVCADILAFGIFAAIGRAKK